MGMLGNQFDLSAQCYAKDWFSTNYIFKVTLSLYLRSGVYAGCPHDSSGFEHARFDTQRSEGQLTFLDSKNGVPDERC